MHDILKETHLSLPDATRHLPPSAGGKPLDPSTIYRWINVGVRSRGGVVVRLEGFRLGRRWLTSTEALARFLTKLSADPTPAEASNAPRAHVLPSAPTGVEETEKELDRIFGGAAREKQPA